MNYYGGREMALAFRTVRANTIKIAEEIDEQKYAFKPSADVRRVGDLLVHVALAPRLQLHIHQNGLTSLVQMNFPEFVSRMRAEEAQSRSKAQILEFLKTEGEAFASYLEGLQEAFLAEPVGMPPGDPRGTKSRFEMLLSPKEHEMHHRGQLMLIERMVGIVPHMTRAMMERMARAAAPAQA